ncbi:FecCD family ABC transporter permease [Antrihabitans sp. NCIMB 15449]|uniref:FecCD family ABC transporter permease n=1 Tax=Antrihabitans spumae TaxID=3373370 RepID=A0ABW7JMC3_9NOCA
MTADVVAAVRGDRRARTRRKSVVLGSFAMLTVVLFVASMMLGSSFLSAPDVVRSVLHLVDEPGIDFIVRDIRLPHSLAALCVGLALGVSGTVFQQLLGNTLASPDFVGVSAGASLAAVVGIVLLHLGGLAISAMAFGGALVSSLLIYILAWRDGITGYRFILIGIGVSEFMLAIVYFTVARARISDAQESMHWLAGSIGQGSDRSLQWLVIALIFLVPAALVLDRQLRTLELGDDTARALGLRVEKSRLALLLIAIVLVAFATAVAGPLAFVALIAGPIARALLGPARGSIIGAALVGAIIVLATDLVCRHLLPTELPTGAITGAVGAPYLLWLIATTNREGRGG